MSNRIKNNLKNLVGQTLNQYCSKVKPTISDLRYKQEYQNRIIECMVGEVDDNYITTPETDNHIVKLEHSKEGIIKILSIKGKTILVDEEGNETDTPGEGCKLVSVGEEEDNKLIILSKNKNLFDGNDYVQLDNKFYIGNKILIKGINSIRFNYNQENNINSYLYIIGLKNNIETTLVGGTPHVRGTYNVLDYDYIYIKVLQRDGNNNLDYIKSLSIQIEEGNTPTDYVLHKSHKTEILLNEPLRRINNNVFDEIVGNKLIRRVGMLYVDGTNDSLYNLTIANHQNIENLQGFDIRLKNNLIVSQPLKCNNVNYVDNRNDEIWVHSGKGNIIVLRVPKEDLVSCDIVGLKEWLKNNPITILYKLDELIIEELPNSITLQGFDDTTMYIENSITPTVQYGYNALIPYKQEILNQKEEVETNTLDIEQNIIPYLMDMEFNLMLMEDE